jgi:hypothetical protein
MKINKYIVGLLIVAISFTGCTKEFETVNTNPTSVTDLSSDLLFTNSVLGVSGGEYEAWRTNLIYNSQFIQHFASLSWDQGNSYRYDEGYNSSLWDSYYGGPIKNLVNLVAKTTGVASDVNYNSAARILKAYAFLRLTDSYGDIPYSEAGKGYISGIFSPKYDDQKSIYTDLVNELDAAAKAFDATKAFKGDITSYAGNTTLWKKAAYSLILRIGMRQSKVDPSTAATVVAKAVAGGLISSVAESFRINHLATNYDNPNSHVLGYYNGSRTELASNSFKFSKTFLDLLSSKTDPRLPILSVVRTGPSSSATIGTEDNTLAIQKGLPSGTNPTGFAGSIATYSQLRSDFANGDVPNILVSHSETLLLLAEARERGWITSSTSEQYFRDGVNAAINQLKLYDDGSNSAFGGLFSSSAINTYTASTLVYPAASTDRIQAINEQYYISTLLDEYEAHANWRRSGFPVLTAVATGVYTNGVIPRRFQYPSSESSKNGTNLNAAITRQGANNWVTHVWWDK